MVDIIIKIGGRHKNKKWGKIERILNRNKDQWWKIK